jgi:hypothetical protein
MIDLSCLYSTVKNTSGSTRFFGFLPPHGKTLEADEEYTIFGNVHEAIIKTKSRVTSARNIHAFERALKDGDLTILSLPAPILEDQHGEPKIIRIDNYGNLVTADPCWTVSISGSLSSSI